MSITNLIGLICSPSVLRAWVFFRDINIAHASSGEVGRKNALSKFVTSKKLAAPLLCTLHTRFVKYSIKWFAKSLPSCICMVGYLFLLFVKVPPKCLITSKTNLPQYLHSSTCVSIPVFQNTFLTISAQLCSTSKSRTQVTVITIRSPPPMWEKTITRVCRTIPSIMLGITQEPQLVLLLKNRNS